MIKAVIFDMDGLMFDTEKLWLEAGMYAKKQMGYNITKELQIKVIGTNYTKMKQVFKKELGPDFDFEYFYNIYRTWMQNQIEKNGIKAKKGLYELLNYLQNKYLIAVASSSKKNIIYKYIKFANIDINIFNCITSGEDFKKGKPAPDIFLKTCELLKIKPNEAIVLEDSNRGLIAAKKAGCTSVLVPDIDIIKKSTEKYIDKTISSLDELINYL